MWFLTIWPGELWSSHRQESHKVEVLAQSSGILYEINVSQVSVCHSMISDASTWLFLVFWTGFMIIYMWRNLLNFSYHCFENLAHMSIIRLKIFANLISITYCFLNIIVLITGIIEHFLYVFIDLEEFLLLKYYYSAKSILWKILPC